ncbi:hypothetical protein [Lachnoclostridium phytofermentans]|uniref:Uncharacterized protein n=1 Tax=Lachnoclostridium phytofermentans (strain ATCC 700394 / DSM 18823 / ISDg) TaxID=357809 RepID=A9KPY3_LACP7|nr:hypothetical protein [Lachnoclostridium phytofermentans]ABX41882.1 conserved hypothetical protein [Lachnoclostridium phytofermentans ISDg]
MSAFLGPIHYWLYNKIMLQEKIVEELLSLNEEEEFVQGLDDSTVMLCGIIENQPLENMIDTGNIHGWLQEKIHIVENRLSYVVTAITKENADRMEQILERVYQVGVEVYNSLEQKDDITSAEQIFKLLNDMLLDGMPCDHINEIVSSTSDEVEFRRTRCIHEVYWLEQGGLVMNYYEIRTKFVQGLLANTAFEYVADDEGNYHIRRK